MWKRNKGRQGARVTIMHYTHIGNYQRTSLIKVTMKTITKCLDLKITWVSLLLGFQAKYTAHPMILPGKVGYNFPFSEGLLEK